MKAADIKVDTKALEEGRWIDIKEGRLKGVRIRCKGFESLTDRRAQSEATRALSPAERERLEDQEIRDKLLNSRLKALVLDWEGIDDLPFSPEMAAEVIDDPDWYQLREAIFAACLQVEQQVRDEKDKAAGNS